MLEHGCDAGMSILVVHDCVWLSGVVLFQVCGCWRFYMGLR